MISRALLVSALLSVPCIPGAFANVPDRIDAGNYWALGVGENGVGGGPSKKGVLFTFKFEQPLSIRFVLFESVFGTVGSPYVSGAVLRNDGGTALIGLGWRPLEPDRSAIGDRRMGLSWLAPGRYIDITCLYATIAGGVDFAQRTSYDTTGSSLISSTGAAIATSIIWMPIVGSDYSFGAEGREQIVFIGGSTEHSFGLIALINFY